MNGSRPLDGRVVVVTGGARGIGRATAAALASRGARVAITDQNGDLAQDAARDVGRGAIAMALDVRDADAFPEVLDRIESSLGPLEVLINNAGVMPLGRLADEPLERMRLVFDVNVWGVAIGSREAIRRMSSRGHGHIVNVASIAGRTGTAGGAAYCASKHAVVGLSAAMADELIGTGIHVSCVMPGPVETELTAGLSQPRGMRRVAPDEVASAIVRTLERPRFSVYVPRSTGAAAVAAAHLSPRTRTRLLRVLGAGNVARPIDELARASYERRVNASAAE